VYDETSLETQLTWFDRGGKRLATVGEPGSGFSGGFSPQLSPDEKQVVVDRFVPETGLFNLWLIEMASGISSRFTFDQQNNRTPVWSPDGARILFTSNREGAYNLYTKLSSGAGKEELLLKSDLTKFPTDWSSDGRFLLYNQTDPKTNYDIWVLPLFGNKQPIPLLRTEFNELDGAFSPDGKWIAYNSDASGQQEVYVQTFPASEGKWQISSGGGSRPKWRHDGKELFYLAADRRIMAVDVIPGATFRKGAPRPLVETRISDPYLTHFAVTRDGQRFLIPTPLSDANAPPATVVINWTAGIKR
jgi:Tol biopolymer transport system component